MGDAMKGGQRRASFQALGESVVSHLSMSYSRRQMKFVAVIGKYNLNYQPRSLVI